MRSRGVRLIARLLIFVLYFNGFAPLTAAAAAAGGGAGATIGLFGGGSGSGGGTGANVSLFGPKRYTRTGGFFNLFTDQISVPNWIRSPYVVRIKNGESDGSHRVSGAFVFLSGLPVATPLDFNQNTDTVERPVLLLPILVQLLGLSVKIFGPTGSYVTVTVLGRSGDTAAPSLTITEPPPNTTTNDTTPNLTVTYGDANQSDCQASGVDTSKLKITLDGIDRTSLFTVTPNGATATIPDNLALSPGTHALHVEIRDGAGNLASADRTFSVQSATQPPTLTISQPAENALVKDENIAVSGTVTAHGSGALAVQCRVGEETRTATITSGTNWSCTVPLAEGDNAIVVSATDSGGTSDLTRHVTRDLTKPAVSITTPETGAYTTAETVTVTGTVSDVHDVNVTVNGVAATLTGNTFEASVPVGNGPTIDITAIAVDAAGNAGDAKITLNVVRGDLDVQITSPVDGAIVPGPMLEVRGTTNREGELPVYVFVNGIEATVASDGTFTAVNVPVLEGEQSIRATARDEAGRTDADDITVRVDSLKPTFTIDEPAANLVTSAASVRVAGRIGDTSPLTTATLNGESLQPDENGQFSKEVDLPTVDGATTLTLVATDSAGNTDTKTITVIVDRTKPALSIASPTNGAIVFGETIVVQGTTSDTNGVVVVTVDGTPATLIDDAWKAEFRELPDGPREFVVRATDAAGNTEEKRVTVTLDNTAPVITLATPAPGTITRLGTIDVTGSVQDLSIVDIVVTPGDLATTASNGTFSVSNVPLAPDTDTNIVVTATDRTGRTSTASILVTRDNTAPVIELTAPGRLTRRESGQATATVSDAYGVAQVVWAIGGVAAGTSTAAPFGIPLVVPEGVAIGATFPVTATATDRAGNVATATTDVRLAADGSIVGQVLSDATGLPLEGAKVLIGSDTRTTDEQGRYTLPTDRESIALTIERNGMTSVSRLVSMAAGAGTVPVDARLTPLAAAVVVGAEGTVLTALSTVGSGPAAPPASGSGGSSGSSGSTSSPSAPASTDPLIGIVVPATAAGASMQLTPLSAQGLPDLLPLGWSPIAAFDLRAAGAVQGELTLRATFAQAQAEALSSLGSTLALVEYRPLLHAWVVVARELALNATTHALETVLTGTGAFALVMPDVQDPPIAVPAVGEPLVGVAAIEIPSGATSQGSVEPAVIPPTGGTARGQLRVDASTPLPSGTLVQAEVTERFTLPSNQVASEEQRRQDIVLYRAPGRTITPGPGSGSGDGGTPAPDATPAVSGTLPITPSRTFDPVALVEGHVHLDILSGRESVRGITGGREAVTVTAEDARLVIPEGALAADTAVSLTRQALSAFLPAHASLTPLSELLIDVPGSSLGSPAELSIAKTPAAEAPDTALVIARVERIDGVPYLTVVAKAEVSGDRVIASATSGLPGVTGSGRYVFYRIDGKLGFVRGITSAGGEATAATVLSTNSLPFIARSDRDGKYMVATLAAGANVTVTARVPRTSLEKSGSVVVNTGTTAELNLELAPTATTAIVDPADGTRGVSRQPQITVTTSAPIASNGITAQNVRLLKVIDSVETPVAARALLAGSGRTLSIVPDARLDADTQYRVDVSGLTDIYGGVVFVPESNFRTASEAAPSYSPDDLTFSFPDADGVVTISSRPGKFFPLGSQFLIINSRSGEVLSFGTQNDGSVNNTIRATLDDQLVITITDPDGRVTTVTRSQFVDPATGRTAIGPGGGVVEGPGGIELRIPEGAVTRAVTLKITPLGPDDFPAIKPDVPDAQFGSGIRIEASAVTRFAKEAKLAFPIPAALETEVTAAGHQLKDAFFYVFNRGLSDDDGEPVYETVDYATVEGEDDTVEDNEKIVTASFPFSGLIDVGGMAAGYAFVMWSFNQALPGRPTSGVITGRVMRPVFQNGAVDPAYVGVPGARVELVDHADTRFEPRAGAITQADGRYTIFDHRFVDGPVSVKTTVDGETARATVFAVQRADSDVLADPALAVLVSKGVFNQIATANLTLPPAQPAAPAPAITVRVMKTVEGRRVDTRGLVGSGTPLIVGIDAGDAEVSGVIIAEVGAAPNAGTSYAVQRDSALEQSPRDPLAMPFVTSETFTPAQAGSYEIRVSALPAFGPAVTTTATIRVLGGGGGVETDPNLPPSVITAQTVPVAGAVGVAVTIVPQIAFTEPVLHIPGNVFLRDPNGAAVPIKISGVGVDTNGQVIEIEEVTSAVTVVTGLTIQPRFGLAYGARYTLELTSGIVDRDPAPDGPRSLVPFTSSFTTFGPEPIGGTETQFASPGLVVLGERAYVLETHYYGGVGGSQSGALRVFDVTDPVQPREVAEPTAIYSAPRDIAGEAQRVAVATMPSTKFSNAEILSGPGNLLIYDVSGVAPQWIGASSLTTGIMDGTPNRVVLKGDMAYVATMRRGLQVVDLTLTGLGDLATAPGWEQSRRLNAPGESVNPGAVTTIPVTDPDAPNNVGSAQLHDLKVGDYTIDDQSKRLVVATGQPAGLGLVIIDPSDATAPPVAQQRLEGDEGKLVFGQAIALAHIAGRNLAVVGGYGTVGNVGAAGVVAVVDLSPLSLTPRGNPDVIAWVALTHGVGDILIYGTTAIVSSPSTSAQAAEGTATLINLADPFNPINAGTLTGIGSRLALAGTMLLSTNKTVLRGVPSDLGGVRTATLGVVAYVNTIRPVPVTVTDGATVSARATPIVARVSPAGVPVTGGEVRVYRDDSLIETLAVVVSGSEAQAIWPAGRPLNVRARYTARAVLTTADSGTLETAPRVIPLLTVDLDIDSDNNNQTGDPSRTTTEDDAEDVAGDPARPGKVVFMNGDDGDGDGVPDYADGINLFDQYTPQASGRFAPMVLELPNGIDIASATIRFTYPGSDPAQMQRRADASGAVTFTLPAGTMRIWTKDGAQARRVDSVANGGDFVPTNQDVSTSVLGKPIAPRTWRFYVESLVAGQQIGDQIVTAQVTVPDEGGPSLQVRDTVRLTTIGLRLVTADAENRTTPVQSPQMSLPSPVIAADTFRLTNVRLAEDRRGMIGDLELAGRITCAVCDFTPGQLGTIENLNVFVNDTSTVQATVAVSGSKASESPSLLKPYAFTGTFSTTLTGVPLANGPNRIRLETTDKVVGGTGYAELSITVTAQAPPVIIFDYRTTLDFGGARSLSELTAETPVQVTLADQGNTGALPYVGAVFKVSETPLTFENSAVRITVLDPAALDAALAGDLRGALDVGVAPLGSPAPEAVYNLRETGDASNVFRDELVDVTFRLAQPVSTTAIDALELELTDAYGRSFAATLQETANGSREFRSADEATIVVLGPEPGEDTARLQATVTAPAFDLTARAFVLETLESDAPSTAVVFATEHGTRIADYDLTTLDFHQIEVEDMTLVGASDGGIFNPLLLQVVGPADLLDRLTGLGTLDGVRHISRAFDGNYYVFMKNSPPIVGLMMPSATAANDAAPSFTETSDFLAGYIVGLGQTGVVLVEGIYTIAKFAAVESFRLGTPIGQMYVRYFDDNYAKELSFAKGSWEIAKGVAQLAASFARDRPGTVLKLLTNQPGAIAEVLATEPMATAVQRGALILEQTWNEFEGASRFEQGRMFGRVIGEIVLVVAPAAKAGSLGQLTKLEVFSVLKSRPFFQSGAGARVLARAEPAMQRIQQLGLCFIAGTQVVTRTGGKAIETIRKGDEVWARDEGTGAEGWRRVRQTIVTHPTRLYHMTYRLLQPSRGGRTSHVRPVLTSVSDDAPEGDSGADGDGDGDGNGDEDGDVTRVLTGTGAHPVYVVDRRAFVEMKDLVRGDRLSLADGGLAEVVSLAVEDAAPGTTFTTYNLEVEDYHTYFAGPEGVWVHNAGNNSCQSLIEAYDKWRKATPGTPGDALRAYIESFKGRPGLQRPSRWYWTVPIDDLTIMLELALKEAYPGTSLVNLWTVGDQGAQLKNFAYHFIKHRFSLKNIPVELDDPIKYFERAKAVMVDPKVVKRVRKGDFGMEEGYFIEDTNEMVIRMTSGEQAGAIKTYYQPYPTNKQKSWDEFDEAFPDPQP